MPESTDNAPEKEQDEFAFEPQYDIHDGVKFTVSEGGLMIPAPGEFKRCEEERGPEMMTVVGSKPVIHVVENTVARIGYKGRSVKMRPMDSIKLRAKG